MYRPVVMMAVVAILTGGASLTAQEGGKRIGSRVEKPVAERAGPQSFRPKKANNTPVWKGRPNDYFDTPEFVEMCDAISKRDKEGFARKVRSDFEINKRGKHGMTVLYWAYLAGNLDAFKLLLERGANPDIRVETLLPIETGVGLFPSKGLSVLGNSMLSGRARPDFYEAGISYTKRPDQPTLIRMTFLQFAAMQMMSESNSELVRKLIEVGADLDSKDHDGKTALHIAVRHNPTAMMELLKAGADPDIPFPDGRSFRNVIHEMSLDPENPLNEYYDRLHAWLEEHPPAKKPAGTDGSKAKAD